MEDPQGPEPRENVTDTDMVELQTQQDGDRAGAAEVEVSGMEGRPGSGAPQTGGPARAYMAGVSDESRARLKELDILEPVAEAAKATLAILSTRLRRSDVASEMSAAVACGIPVVVLAHTGGESTAVELMRGGGAVVIAEGNESVLPSYLAGGASDSGLLETYDRRIGSASSHSGSGDTRDAATGLPSLSSFEERLEHLNQSGELPRLAFLRILGLGRGLRMSDDALALLRRRLAMQYLALARMQDAELFMLRDSELALVAVGLSPNRTEGLARQMGRVTESFAPSGAQPLALAVGHAGAEVASEIATLRELASRAVAVAAESGTSRVVGADSLSLGLAATTELEAALRILEVVEQDDAYEPGHGARVASLAHDIARYLGFEPAERTQVRLAAHLADIGKIGSSSSAVSDPEAMSTTQRQTYEGHPKKGADYVRTSAGDMVADGIEGHHERWDGSGFPHGLAGNDIPLISRIIAAADRFDGLVHPADASKAVSVTEALEVLRNDAGVGLDPGVVEAVMALMSERNLVPVRIG